MKTILTNLAILSASAFNNAGWKIDADGKIETKDGNPIWVDADGSEKTLSSDAISRANNDAKNARIAKEKAEEKLAAFTGLDADKARAALDTVSKLDQKKLIDAGEVDKVRNEISAQFTTQLAEKDKALSELQTRFDGAQIANIFGNSEFIRNRVAVPAEMFQAYFSSNVKMVNGQPEFYGRDGNRLLSKTKIGENVTDASEAFEMLVESHPQKDLILKANDNSGSGSNGNGGNRPGGRTIKRSEFEQLAPNKQHEVAAKMRTGEMTIVD